MKKTHVISFRAGKPFYQHLKAKAKAAGQKLSAYALGACQKGASL